MTIDGCDNLIAKLDMATKSLSDAGDRGALHNYIAEIWQVGYDEASKCYAEAVTLESEPAN